MANGNDIYLVRQLQTFLGQSCINNYWYQIPSDPGDSNADDLAEVFITTFSSVFEDLMSELWQQVQLDVINWRDTSDSNISTTSITGENVTGAEMPSFVSLACKFPPAQPGQRWARKAYTGQVSSVIRGNAVEDDPTAVPPLLTALGTNLVGSDGTYFPVQIRTSTLPPMGTGQPFAIRGLTNGGSINWIADVGSQVSRKAGQGD